jgi:hypothetical protein
LAVIVVVSALGVFGASPTFSATPHSYAWGYYNTPSNPVEGNQGTIYTGSGGSSAYEWIAGQVGVCNTGTALCSTNFIEIGIGGGSDTSQNNRQYVRYDNNGTETIWWDSNNNLDAYHLYRMRIAYVGGGTPTWKAYRAPCTSADVCETLTEIYSVSASSVGFSAGESVYAGAAGYDADASDTPLPLSTAISYLRYGRSSTYTLWDWYPNNYVVSDSCYTIFQTTQNEIQVASTSC